ncbi:MULTISPECIES: sulfite exporter TauE/SafE family protein [unclassified Pseudodesulfovibrio]|uniref:sulfite exporter TauE/SafE family protein n=1 Tax=unclassified Pseudodesulfovibrio TaxID=2661612 RepID=UPI000FEBA175|nr:MULTISPECIES: sulfite exporter TauE/SafE family protein [unclassified Pseudodesulfovibrio]MCJ2163932.1 sulfite exporter TauE/SafE family protein [Pseudodesulfovibrio sp. S3-i]RWU05823.1 sulfite exporter TauE/SafE family protein [Pseudodesulfovibrio sp. S3]
MLELVAIISIVLVAAFLQGLTGFGFGLIALPLLGLFLNIKTCVPLMVLLAVLISLYLSIRLRDSIHLKSIFTLMLATLPGIPLGVYVLKHVSTQTLSIGLGILMILFTSHQLLYKPKSRQLKPIFTVLAGLLSGFLGGSIGAGGPPVIIYTALQPWSKDQVKATLACYFAISGLIIIASHAISGMITHEVLRLYSMSLPALVAGIYLGTLAYKHISDHGYRKLAFILVFLLGLMMIFKNI